MLIAQVLMPGPAGPKPRPRINYARFHTIIPPPLTVELKVQNRIANLVYDRVPGFDSGQVRFFLSSHVAYWFCFVYLLGPALSSLLRALLQHRLSNRVFKKF